LHFEGVFDVGATRAKVFELVTDPKQVAGCMPDLQKVDVRSPDEFDAVVKVGVSFIRGDFIMRFRTTEKDAPSSAKMMAHGSGLGSAVDMEIVVTLTEGKAGGTSMRWGADATVSGKIASLGQRLMESQAEKIIKNFFACFREKLERT
jgi:uncharacterized protein